MDVHKESIEIALTRDGIGGEVRRFGCIAGTRDAFTKALRKLVSTGKNLHFCYEAGPTGYELHRYIEKQGYIYTVVALSLIPKKADDKVKTDKRDTMALARLYRAGELTAVYVPNPEDEAMRDLCRARQDAVELRTRAKQRLNLLCVFIGAFRKMKKNTRRVPDMSYEQTPWLHFWRRYFSTFKFFHQFHTLEMVVPLLSRIDHKMEHKTVSIVIMIPWQKKESIAKIRVNLADVPLVPIDSESDTFVERL